jgi:hypothetical protein
MQIYPIDDKKRIFQIVDLLDQETVDWMNTVDWLSIKNYEFDSGDPKYIFPRKILDSANSDVIKLTTSMQNKLSTINNLIETSLNDININLWLDGPGFKMVVHTDEGIERVGVIASLQLYLFAPNEDYGTEFFTPKEFFNPDEDYDTVLFDKYKRIPFNSYYKFKSIPNTGYLMLNHLNEDGSLPMLWHGMLNPVPEGCYRLSAYWYFK